MKDATAANDVEMMTDSVAELTFESRWRETRAFSSDCEKSEDESSDDSEFQVEHCTYIYSCVFSNDF